MPLRFLEYIGRIYEHILSARTRYFRKLVKIPTPEFYVFYNGVDDYPAAKTLQLSDAFMLDSIPPNLELIVQVININHDKRHELLDRCKPLAEYSEFVEIVRQNIEKDKKHGFENAIKEAMQNNVLKEYLQRKTKEVRNMLIADSQPFRKAPPEKRHVQSAKPFLNLLATKWTDYDYATDIEVQREEAMQQGMQQGAQNLKKLGIAFEIISKATGLSIEEIAKL